MRWRALAAFAFLLLLLLSIPAPATAQSGDKPCEGATIWGYVYDRELEQYLPNLTVEVEREFYLGNSTRTDNQGYYKMDLPYGSFILRIKDVEGYIIYRHDFNITDGEVKRLDFTISSTDKAQSTISGTIQNKFTLTPMEEAEVLLYKVNATSTGLEAKTDTDGKGRFKFVVPAGEYELQVWSEDSNIYKKRHFVNFSEEKNLKLTLESPSSSFTPENAWKLISREYINIILIIVILVVGLLLIAFIDKVFSAAMYSIKTKPRRFIDESILLFSERVVKWNILILMLIFWAYLIAQILDIVSTLWVPIRDSIVSIYSILLLIIVMRIVLMIWKQFIRYLKGDHRSEKPKKILSSRMITLIEIIGKYGWTFIFLLLIILTALGAIGMSDMIIGGFMDSLANNAGFLIFIITLLIIAYVIVKFMGSFFEDMKYKSSRFRPEMIEIAGKGLKFVVYGIIAMIVMFTILSAAGLGEIGQTMIIVFSMILGLVVSMAATGSIGNILSGMVIMSFKPFEEGDWVILADKHEGEIIETNLMFTKMRDLENEVIEIPNNLILSQGIVNWTSAAKRGGFAIEVDATIGYDVPAKQVMKLMVESSKGVEGILPKPEPHAVMTVFLDHAIGYKLRAYIDTPHHRNKIKTEVMVKMQRTFMEAGVEILSPLYQVDRMERIPNEKEVKKRVERMDRFE